MRRLQKLTTEGFTVIEISIVLSIAGLLFLVLFNAIPALQRTGRNNERKQDVAKILQAVSRFALNNGGNFPDSVESDPTSGSYILKNTKLSLYETADITFDFTKPVQLKNTDIGKLIIANYQKCDATEQGKSTSLSADYRDIVALYATETRGGSGPQCQQL